MSGSSLLMVPVRPLDCDALVREARERWNPIRTVCLFSGGNDSGVVAHRCRDLYDELLFIDTGLAVPGVEEHIVAFAEWLGKPLAIRRSGEEYRTMVLGDDLWWERYRDELSWNPELTVGQAVKEQVGRRLPTATFGNPPHGFPGAGQHGRAYIRLKERRIADHMRELKAEQPRNSAVLFVSGVRRAESSRRATREPFTERRSAKYVNPLIDWSDERMRAYRERQQLPESDVAALLHRSGECNCGAFAKAQEERAMLYSLWPRWWEDTIEALEDEAERRGIRYCRWGGYDLDGNQAAGASKEKAGPLCTSCELRMFEPDGGGDHG